MGKRRKEVDLNKLLHCSVCPFVDICHELCLDMQYVLKESGMGDAFRNEIPSDPVKLDNIDRERGLYSISLNQKESDEFIKKKSILSAFIVDFISSRLTEKQRNVLNLFFFQSMNQEEMANILNTSQENLSLHKNLAIKKMRRYIGKFGLLNKDSGKIFRFYNQRQ